MGRAFEQTRVDIEDVPRKGLATRRPPEQEGQLAIGTGMLSEVVVHDQDVPARVRKIFRDTGRGIWRYIGETRGVVTLGDNNHCIVHRALIAQAGHHLRHGRSTLANSAVHA